MVEWFFRRSQFYEVYLYLDFQIDRMEQFFVSQGLPHLMFYYQDTEPLEAGKLSSNTFSQTKCDEYVLCNY